MSIKADNLVHLVVPFYILHFIEEVATRFYEVDLSIKYISQTINLTPLVTFLLIQIILFIFLAILLFFILIKKQIHYLLVILLSIILLYEFTHTYETVVNNAYFSGAITGTIIGVIGLVFIYSAVRKI